MEAQGETFAQLLPACAGRAGPPDCKCEEAFYGGAVGGGIPTRVLQVDAGALGGMPLPAGPGIAPYAGGEPWPWDRFD
jgi:hypothetical protein